jgi:serine/threonine protein kinase
MARPFIDAVPELSDDALIGQQLGEYRIERYIAEGSMGVVYSAVHQVLKRRAAVKVVKPEHARGAEQEDRFLKEAEALSEIRHQGIIDIYSFGRLPDGRQYMVTEFLEGKTLEATLHASGRMEPERALPIVDEILDALSAAHKVGVVHRDLKPSNVFLAMQSNGQTIAKLVDFGLARKMGNASGPGFFAGTPEYISPEGARGDEVTPASDLYSLGVMLFEMLTGGLPFPGTNVADFLRAHIATPAPRLSSWARVRGSLDGFCASLLEKSPRNRPSSANAARRTVAQILHELSEDATDHSIKISPEKLAELTKSKPWESLPFEDTQVPLPRTALRGEVPAGKRETMEGPTPTPFAPNPPTPVDDHSTHPTMNSPPPSMTPDPDGHHATLVVPHASPAQPTKLFFQASEATEEGLMPLHAQGAAISKSSGLRIAGIVLLVSLLGAAAGGVLFALTR